MLTNWNLVLVSSDTMKKRKDNEELCDPDTSLTIIRKRQGRTVSRREEKEKEEKE